MRKKKKMRRRGEECIERYWKGGRGDYSEKGPGGKEMRKEEEEEEEVERRRKKRLHGGGRECKRDRKVIGEKRGQGLSCLNLDRYACGADMHEKVLRWAPHCN